MSYDYPEIIVSITADLESIKGRTLTRLLVNAVNHEFNVLYLKFEADWFAVSPYIGGEILAFQKCEAPSEGKADDRSTRTLPFPQFGIFENRKVATTRHIGEAWNGHGFEFTFADLFDKTLIVQSIYTGGEPKDFFDCLRLGIGTYFYDATTFN